MNATIFDKFVHAAQQKRCRLMASWHKRYCHIYMYTPYIRNLHLNTWCQPERKNRRWFAARAKQSKHPTRLALALAVTSLFAIAPKSILLLKEYQSRYGALNMYVYRRLWRTTRTISKFEWYNFDWTTHSMGHAFHTLSLSRDFVEAAEAGIVNKNKIKMEQNETKTRRSHPRVKSFDQCDLALCWQLPLEFLTAAMVKFAQKDAQITERTSFVSYFVRIFYYSILRRRLIPVHDDMIRCCLYMFRIGERWEWNDIIRFTSLNVPSPDTNII